MEEKDIELKAKKLRENLGSTKKAETEQETKLRMKSVLQTRDAAMQTIFDYQEKTGIPSEDETVQNFLEVESKQNEEN